MEGGRGRLDILDTTGARAGKVGRDGDDVLADPELSRRGIAPHGGIGGLEDEADLVLAGVQSVVDRLDGRRDVQAPADDRFSQQVKLAGVIVEDETGVLRPALQARRTSGSR